ncbi:MAG: NAD(P)/FAD-dependent oxidoreductase [Acidimicrobiales bacterium]
MSGPLLSDGTVVVVGASLAGLRASQTLREGGFTGTLVLVGEERHLPYDRPPLSKQVLSGKWPPERTALADEVALGALHLDLRLGRRATSLDAAARRVTLDDGAQLDADGIVLATGASPRRLPGIDGVDVFTLRTLDDAAKLREAIDEAGPGARVAVVGAGFIGSEVAATCAELGCEVVVLEALQTPLEPALGELVGAACGALHVRHGVELRAGAPVATIEPATTGSEGSRGSRSRQVVHLSHGDPVSADVVVVGIGVIPNTRWLEGSGLELADGVVCDAGLFAADGVVAAGDLARWMWRHHGEEASVRIEHWEVASQMGVAAAKSLLAGREAATDFDPVPYFWSDQYGLRIQVLGHPEPTDEVAVVDGRLDAEDAKFVAIYGRAGKLTAALAVSRPRQLMAFRPLLAAGATFDEGLALLEA